MSVGSTSISAVVPDTVFATHFMAVLRLPDSTHIQNQMQKMLPIATALLDEGASACCTRGRAGGVTFSVFTILKMSCPPISQQNKVFPENLKGGPQSSVRVTLPCHRHSRRLAAMADFIYDDLEPANIAAAQVLIATGRPHMPFLVSPAPNTCERTPPAAERAGRKRHVYVCMCVCVCVYVCCGGSIASSSNLSAPALTAACCLAVRASCWERFSWWC